MVEGARSAHHLTPVGVLASGCPSSPSARVAAWAALKPSPWVFLTMTQGYWLQFFSVPSVTRVPPRPKDIAHRISLCCRSEIIGLIKKGAIREVENQTGFFSRYFLIPKQGGDLRPIFNLRGLNKYLRPLKCKMLTVPRV